MTRRWRARSSHWRQSDEDAEHSRLRLLSCASCLRGYALLRCAPLSLPLRAQGCPIDGLPAQIDRADLPRVVDVLERVRVQDDEVGALAGRHGAKLIQAENLG